MNTAHPSGYNSPAALWSAVLAKARTAAQVDRRRNVSNLQRQFVYDRLLARVFAGDDGRWVLKGGTALLARVRSARHSIDIDLFRRDGSLAHALDELRAMIGRDLHDHFRFETTGPRAAALAAAGRAPDGATQPGVARAQVAVDAYVGVQKVSSFRIDVVTGSLITSDPDRERPTAAITIPSLSAPDYLLYPVVDHVADKVCAITERHGTGQAPSSRHRDLVDLVVIARTQRVAATPLREAINAERHYRGLAPISHFATPAGWEAGYAKEARDVPQCVEHRSYAAAMDLVGRFLGPVLSGGLTDDVWVADLGHWVAPGRGR